jgi:uncharacterized membrane protein
MNDAAPAILLRYLHILAAAFIVGGLACSLLFPTSTTHTADSIARMAHRRLGRLLWIAVAILVATGLYNWATLAGLYAAIGPAATFLIGVKVFSALLFFTILWAHHIRLLHWPSRTFWHACALSIAAVVMLFASTLRYVHLQYLLAFLRPEK